MRLIFGPRQSFPITANLVMKFKDISNLLAQWAPPSLAESYDNVGLLVGNPNTECTGVLINLDVTESLIDEALEKGVNLIVTHHPIWFGARKRLNGEDYVSRIIIKAIKSDVGLLACHTNLDNVNHGVNYKIGQLLGVEQPKILSPKRDLVRKLSVYVPQDATAAVQDALFAAGAGQIGNYSEASFTASGTGTFKPMAGAQPAIGTIGERESVAEHLLEVIFPDYLQGAVLRALQNAHPYEVPAYQVVQTIGKGLEIGSGMIGDLQAPMAKADFLAHVKKTFRCGGIRYADFPGETIQKVAWCGGAGSFLTRSAIRAGADAFVTGDITYHKYFDNEDSILLMDIGHYESEQFTSQLLRDFISEKFATFAVHLSEIETNPVKYF